MERLADFKRVDTSQLDTSIDALDEYLLSDNIAVGKDEHIALLSY